MERRPADRVRALRELRDRAVVHVRAPYDELHGLADPRDRADRTAVRDARERVVLHGAPGVARPAEVRVEQLGEAVVEEGRLAPAGERVRRFALHIRDDELAPEAADAHDVASVQVRRRLLRPAAPGGVAALVPLPSRIAEAPAVPVG